MKYVIVNGNRHDSFSLGVYLCGEFDDLEEAKRSCQTNIAEDYGYSSFEEFEDDIDFYDSENELYNQVYEIGYDDFDGHEEIYKVYKVEA